MPKIVLDGAVLTNFDQQEVESILEYMAKAAEEIEYYNACIAQIMQGAVNAYETETTLTRKQGRLDQGAKFYCHIFGLAESQSSAITLGIIRTFINGARQDAENAKGLKDFIRKIMSQETIEISLLATFYFTLKKEWERMLSLPSKYQPGMRAEKRMISRLLIALEPLVFSADEGLKKSYYFCEKAFEHKPIKDIKESVKTGVQGELYFTRSYIEDLIKAMNRIGRLSSCLSSAELERLDSMALQYGKALSFIEDMPTCYNLSLDNYSLYPFSVLYYMANLYEKLKTRYAVAKNEEDNEWVNLQKELQTYVEETKKLTEQKKVSLKQMRECVKEEREALVEKTTSTGADTKLKQLNKDHLQILLELFDPNAKVLFADFKKSIEAMDGKVDIVSGSCTRILLHSSFFSLTELEDKQVGAGGFHKNHEQPKPLHHVQKCLARKSLERAGITQAVLQEYLNSKILASKEEKKERIALGEINTKSKIGRKS